MTESALPAHSIKKLRWHWSCPPSMSEAVTNKHQVITFRIVGGDSTKTEFEFITG